MITFFTTPVKTELPEKFGRNRALTSVAWALNKSNGSAILLVGKSTMSVLSMLGLINNQALKKQFFLESLNSSTRLAYLSIHSH